MRQHGAAGRTVAAAAGVELVRLDEEAPGVPALREAVVRHRLLPGQQRFAGRAAHTLPRADADPNRTPFAVVLRGQAVGFGVIDRTAGVGEFTDTPQYAVLLRSFYIDLEWQGHGVGRAVCAALGPFVRAVAPGTGEILLTVNEANTAAIRAYLAGGFRDTGRRYLGGDAGPQLVLRRAVD
ncbi:GNAT family N-acetyltransferase [Allosalinactinospora lopnorensis]|uniref:GNAT family N-acetyltransferase n=1 Tax=Allosalinactinospora lopnorensis TaxID=1352348 RepID=UPI000623C3C3|nr:GNAT family N-acetyltransferase [Allosalinactinospora lopnorensis]